MFKKIKKVIILIVIISLGILLYQSRLIQGTLMNYQTIHQMSLLHTDISEAGKQLRKEMVKRNETITINIKSKTPLNRVGDKVYQKAIEHTGVGNEGDYLKLHLSKLTMKTVTIRGWQKYYYQIHFKMHYLTNAQQEQELAQKIKGVSLLLNKKSTIDKVRYINNYITRLITYDSINHQYEYTAYGGACLNKAVCQGYTLLLYRMLLNEKIDNRIITGEGISGNQKDLHAWNIIKVGHYYYNHDVTWNDSSHNQYFLTDNKTFSQTHHPDQEFLTHSFQNKYPLSSKKWERT